MNVRLQHERVERRLDDEIKALENMERLLTGRLARLEAS
jgi:hypothetical protein